MKLKHRPGFETSDGKFFSDRTDATAHEYALKKKELIRVFLEQGPGANYAPRGKITGGLIIGDFCDMLSEKRMVPPWIERDDDDADSA